MDNALNGLYTLEEIAIHNNYNEKDISSLKGYITSNKINLIKEKFPELEKFLPFCDFYKKRKGSKTEIFLAMSAEIYDNYCVTGQLPDLESYDNESDIKKLEYWEYNPPLIYSLNPYEDWEFAENIMNNKGYETVYGDIWRMFLVGNARMNYYSNEDIKLEKRIKLALMEYMIRRPQFFNLDDFRDNEILHIKYGGKKI